MTFSRRQILRGAAGLGGAAALKAALIRKAALAAGGTAPKRLILIFTPNGTIPTEFWPDGLWPKKSEYPTQYQVKTDLRLGRILAPLERHKKDLLFVRGPGYKGWEVKYGSPCGSVGDHSSWSVFTNNCPIGRSGQYMGGNASLDQEVAKTLGRDTLRPSLVVSGAGYYNNQRGYISYSEPGKPVPAQPKPLEAYNYLFGQLDGSSTKPGADALATRLALRRSVLDTVRGDIRRLQPRLPSAERPKLEAQMLAVRGLEEALDRAAAASRTCKPGDPTYPTGGLKVPDAVKLHFKTIAGAFACDLTRVASVMVAMAGGDNLGVDWVSGFPRWGYHDLAHSTLSTAGGAKPESVFKGGANDYWISLSAGYATLVAELVDQLKAIPEGDGSVFDNTVIYWAHEMERGDSHWDPYGVPILIIGSGGGSLKTGRLVQAPGNAHYGDVLLSLSHAVGHKVPSFGNPQWCSGPMAALHG